MGSLKKSRQLLAVGMHESGKHRAIRAGKAITKLRAALRENKADDHLLIVRGGDNDTREYTMVLRCGDKP